MKAEINNETKAKCFAFVADSKHYTLNLKLMFNKGTTRQICTLPAIAQNTCYVPLNFKKQCLR